MSTGKKVKSSVMIHEDVWQEIRILAIRERKEIGELVEEIFKERLERTYQQHPELQQPRFQPRQQQQLQSQHTPGLQSQEGHTQQVHTQVEGDQKSSQNGIFGKPIMAPLRKGQVEINLTIPELTFPTDKQKIRQSLLKSINEISQTINLNSDPEILNNLKHYLEIMKMNLDIVENLLMFKKVYKDVGQIEEEIIKAPKNRLANLNVKYRPEGTIGGCKIRWGPDIAKDRMGMKLIT